MSGHTPGPWELRTEEGLHKIIGPHHPAVGRPPVAFHAVYGTGVGHQDRIDECLANARLIAAAPDLLEVAQRTLAMVTEGAGPPDWDWIREVIAKAEASQS